MRRHIFDLQFQTRLIPWICISLFFTLRAYSGCTNDKVQLKAPSSSQQVDAQPSRETLEACKKDPSTCASLDIENSSAEEAYTFGCHAGVFYSCFRLGQFHEIKKQNLEEALKAYEKSCAGQDVNGCESEQLLRPRLCYIEKKKSYCKGEPTGEYRILVFLETLNPKYEDSFVSHDFSNPFMLKEVSTLYKKRIEEKNKALLRALRLAKKKGYHDGSGVEGIQMDIWKLEGNEEMLKGLE